MANIHRILTEIQQTQSFEKLESFKHPSVWKEWPRDERLLLAQLLVMQGAHQLAQGNLQVLESFKIACQVSTNDLQILMRQGNILASHRENIRCLYLASQAFATAIESDPTHVHAWVSRAFVLTEIGLFENESSYIQEAHHHFEKAFALSKPAESDNLAQFFWRWGTCLASLGRVSGEPLDFHLSLEKFHRAHELGAWGCHFFLDFGHSFADLAALLERGEFFSEALKLFNQAVASDPEEFEAWYDQACCLQCLIKFTPQAAQQDSLYEQAEISFEKAAAINPECGQLWLIWGQLQAAMGKAKLEKRLLVASLEKFAKAYQIEPTHPQILNCWAEAILFIASQEERLDLLHEAKRKILASLENQPDDPHTWYLYGSCLVEFGRYFSHEEAYFQAIEKFEYGLSLSRHHPLLWYGLALANFELGEMTQEEAYFEKAARQCSQVLDTGGGMNAQFWNDWGVILLKLAELSEQSSYAELAIDKFELILKYPIEDLEHKNVDLEWAYNYGCAYDLLGELTEDSSHFEKGVQILTQVVQLEPGYNQARYNLALALSHLGEALHEVEFYQKALEHFQVLINEDLEDDMIHLDFGMLVTDLALLIHDVNHPEAAQALFKLAESQLMQASALGNAQAYYQLAGLYSVTEHLDQAMHFLERAQDFHALPGIEDLLHDEWLDPLRQTPAFRQFIHELSTRQSTDDLTK